MFPSLPLELATLVVLVGPSTGQDSHLAGKRGASQGSPLRVPRGPIGYGRTPSLYRAMMRSTYIRLGLSSTHAASSSPIARPCFLRGRDVSSCACRSGNTLSPWLRGWWSHKTTCSPCCWLRLPRLPNLHRGRVGRLFIEKSLMEKKAKLNAQLFCAHIRWRLRSAKGMCSADPECTPHSSIPKSEVPVLVDLTTKSAKNLEVQPPATVELGLCSQLFITSLTTLLSLRWS